MLWRTSIGHHDYNSYSSKLFSWLPIMHYKFNDGVVGLLLCYLVIGLLGSTQASPALPYIITTLLIRVDL